MKMASMGVTEAADPTERVEEAVIPEDPLEMAKPTIAEAEEVDPPAIEEGMAEMVEAPKAEAVTPEAEADPPMEVPEATIPES